MQRFDTLDGLRGVAALAVVLRHAGAIGGPGYIPFSYLAVDLFFMMSGFVIAHAYEAKILQGMSFKQFMGKRILRLAPLFFVGMLFAVFTILIRKFTGIGDYYCYWQASLFLTLLLIPTPFFCEGGYHAIFPFNGPAWSLSLEVAGNAAYHLVAQILTNAILITISVISGTVILIIVLNSTGPDSLNIGYTLDTWWAGAIRFIFSFTVGIIIFRFYDKFPNFRNTIMISMIPYALPAFLAFVLLNHYFANAISQIYILSVVFVIFPIMILFSVKINTPKNLQYIFKTLGNTSYAIYIIHHPIIKMTEQLSNYIGFDFLRYKPQFSLLLIAALFGLALSLEKFYDRPLRRWVTLRHKQNSAI
ncbi:acyltransferase [Asticcacaulis sp. DW145]|uniref:acyltransferase family protein n=1 Tax=Asticcacaulis sp. DW145 TaxID=3095608 RepID=UPI003093299B|nr:acyltransferase [Asticcacaulis sp. DW145]